MAFVSRGWNPPARTRLDPELARRVPPGQHVEHDWPVLTAGPTPHVSAEDWRLRIDGLVDQPGEWSLDDLKAMEPATFKGDIHCVTTWTNLDVTFGGVTVQALLDLVGVQASASHVLATSYGGYTTNLPIEDVQASRAYVVWEHGGEPLSREHGGPVRLLVPHLYFWKSAKWVAELTVLDHDERGFWEVNGYHDRGDPWREQRFHGD